MHYYFVFSMYCLIMNITKMIHYDLVSCSVYLYNYICILLLLMFLFYQSLVKNKFGTIPFAYIKSLEDTVVRKLLFKAVVYKPH